VIINNAGSRCSVGFWTKHLQNTEENERAELKEIRGLKATDLHEALLEMQEEASILPRLKNFMYHADFNPRAHERLTEEEWERTFEIFEKQRGIPQGTPRIVYEHEKQGRVHRHVIWTRLDVENMRAFPDGLDWKVAHTAARKIEKELGLQKTIGPLDREVGTPRPPRAPEPWEMYRAMKTGIDPRAITAEVTELFHQSDNGKAFHAALEKHGYRLATGRRGLLILDSAGKEHSLAKRIDGINTKELNAFMRDVDRTALPTVEQAKEQYLERKLAGLEADRATVQREIAWEEALAKASIEREKTERKFVEQGQEKEQARGGREKDKDKAQKRIDEWLKTLPAPDPKSIGGQIREAYSQSDNASSFASALKEKNLDLAVVTPDESRWIHRGNPYLQEPGKYVPRSLEAGEFVVLNERGHLYQLNVRNTGKTRAEVEAFMGTLDRKEFQGIDTTRNAIQARGDEREIMRRAFRDASSVGLLRRDRKPMLGRIRAERTKDTPRDSLDGASLRVVGKILDVASTAFESLISPVLTPEQKRDAKIAVHERLIDAGETTERSKHHAEIAQERMRHERENRRPERGGHDRER